MRSSLWFYPAWELYIYHIFKSKENVTQVCLNGLSHVCNTNYNKQALFTWKEKKKKLFLLSVKMLLLQLPVIPRNTVWTTWKLVKRSYESLPLYHKLFDISANLACPCGRYALLQNRHTSPKWTIMCSPTHSVQQEKKITFSNRLWQNDGSTLGARGCRETQSAQSQAWKHAIKVHFIEITLLKVQSQTFDLCALFLVDQPLFARSLIPAVCHLR